jgi:hypothetical protein
MTDGKTTGGKKRSAADVIASHARAGGLSVESLKEREDVDRMIDARVPITTIHSWLRNDCGHANLSFHTVKAYGTKRRSSNR